MVKFKKCRTGQNMSYSLHLSRVLCGAGTKLSHGPSLVPAGGVSHHPPVPPKPPLSGTLWEALGRTLFSAAGGCADLSLEMNRCLRFGLSILAHYGSQNFSSG